MIFLYFFLILFRRSLVYFLCTRVASLCTFWKALHYLSKKNITGSCKENECRHFDGIQFVATTSDSSTLLFSMVMVADFWVLLARRHFQIFIAFLCIILSILSFNILSFNYLDFLETSCWTAYFDLHNFIWEIFALKQE